MPRAALIASCARSGLVMTEGVLALSAALIALRACTRLRSFRLLLSLEVSCAVATGTWRYGQSRTPWDSVTAG